MKEVFSSFNYIDKLYLDKLLIYIKQITYMCTYICICTRVHKHMYTYKY